MTPHANDFKVLVSGEVDQILLGFLRAQFGREAGEDQNKKYWKIENIQNVASVIERFDQR